MKTLIVDDSRAMRTIIRQSLGEYAGEVLNAEHGQDALNRLEEVGTADLAMVDWNMPVMNGLDFVKAVRADPRHAAMKICMVTTETEMESIIAALTAGADEYLMKPFTKDAMIEKLHILGIA